MKNRKTLKLMLMILICVLITLVGFVGIYSKNKNTYVNKIGDYQFAPDLKGTTVLELEVDKSTNNKYYDKDGKEVDSSEVTDKNNKNYTTKEELINPEESLSKENYIKTVKILKERLAFLQADQYSIDLDKGTGKIVLTFEDEYPDDIRSILPMEGKLELKDSNTDDVILDYNSIKKAEATYASDENGKYVIYMNLALNKEGLDKIKNIEPYKISTNDNGEVTTNKFKVEFDTEEIEEVSYDDIILLGKTLRITLNKDLDSDSTINSKLNTATVVSKLATIGKTPVIYNITAQEYINSNSKIEFIFVIIGLVIILSIAISVLLIVKYKLNGLLAVLGIITNIALFNILIKITNIPISLNVLAAIIALIIMNTYLVINILKAIKEDTDKTVAENVKKAYLKSVDIVVINLILFVVFAFSKMTVINSMGLFLFWGWLVIMLGNLMFTVTLLAIKNNK